MSDMANFTALSNGAGGPINATLNVGAANSLLRATDFDATPVDDDAVDQRPRPRLSPFAVCPSSRPMARGAWRSRTQSQAAPVASVPRTSAPVVQPNNGGGTAPGKLFHFADPGGYLPPGSRLRHAARNLLRIPAGHRHAEQLPLAAHAHRRSQLTLADALNVAHAGALLGAISSFPAISFSACNSWAATSSAYSRTSSAAPAFATTQNLHAQAGRALTPRPAHLLVRRHVDLYFHWKDEDPTKPSRPSQRRHRSWPATALVVAGHQPYRRRLAIPALEQRVRHLAAGRFPRRRRHLACLPTQAVFDGPLESSRQFFTSHFKISLASSIRAAELPPGDTAHEDPAAPPPGLNVNFSDGKLVVTDNFHAALHSRSARAPSRRLARHRHDARHSSASTSTSWSASARPTRPCHWIVDPLSGTFCLQAGVQNNAPDILIQAGIGIGPRHRSRHRLRVRHPSSSPSRFRSTGTPAITLLFLLTGQAEVDVLGGLASAAHHPHRRSWPQFQPI